MNQLDGWAVDVINPRELSAKMLKKNKINLNEISHDSASGLVNRVLNMGVFLTEVYVDTVGDPEKYRIKLSESFPFVKFVVAKKAEVRSVSVQLCRTTSGLGEKQAIYTRTLTVLDVSGP
ncbi:Ribonuclease H2 subunit A [Populus alba x Populus x berolinensis]|nr:Ribonuclease H2 subunit A [Populus alba x Populus x berolinensis]